MYNSFGFNRKTVEEDKKILAAVQHHHDVVAARGYLVIMTSLIGSQNYDLDTENSDIDTISLVFPSLRDLAQAKEPHMGVISIEDGMCNIKDIRLALDLLRKTSPNSVEYFVSKYKVYNPMFEAILREYLDDNNKIWNMIHCNYNHMFYAIAGMAHQLTKRHMHAGKRFSHALRLKHMQYNFINSYNASSVLDMRPGGDRDLALIAKQDKNPDFELEYNEQCEQIAKQLDEIRDNFKLTEEQELKQQTGLALIDSLQWKLFKKYLMETNNEWN